MRKNVGRGWIVALAVAGLGADAEAGGFATARFGGPHGHPTTAHPTAIYYNPAGLSLSSGTRVFVEGLFAYRLASFDRDEGAIGTVTDDGTGTPTNGVEANSGKNTLTNYLVSPFVGVSSDLGVPNLGVGFGAFVPFGGQASWDKDDDFEDSEAFPGAVDGSQRWATISGSLRTLYLSGAASYRLPGPRISFGASVSVIRESLDTTRARTASGTDDLIAADGSLVEGRSRVVTAGTTIGAGFGVIWEAIDGLHLGLSYQSQPGFGETSQRGELYSKFGAADSSVSEIELLQELPDIIRWGGRYRAAENVELRLFGDYTRWSVLEKQCLVDANNPDADCTLTDNGGNTSSTEGVIVSLPRNWKDTFGVRFGGSYWLDPDKELVADVSYDSNAVPDANLDPAFMDMNKVVTVVGGRFNVTSDLRINATYTHVFYFNRSTDPRERDAMDMQIGFDPPSVTPDMAGDYTNTVGALNLGAEYIF